MICFSQQQFDAVIEFLTQIISAEKTLIITDQRTNKSIERNYLVPLPADKIEIFKATLNRLLQKKAQEIKQNFENDPSYLLYENAGIRLMIDYQPKDPLLCEAAEKAEIGYDYFELKGYEKTTILIKPDGKSVQYSGGNISFTSIVDEELPKKPTGSYSFGIN